MKMRISHTNWGVVVIDIAVIIMAVVISIWQNNPKYLFLLFILAFTGKEYRGGD